MIELEQEDPIPQGDLALQITALPRETNGFGDIYGGWLVSQMDLAGTAMASKIAGGRIATVAIDRMAFMVPVAVGAAFLLYPDPGSRPQLDPHAGRGVERRPAVQRMAQSHRGGVRVRRHRWQRAHPPGPATPGLDAGTPAIAGVLVCAFLRPARGCRVPAHPRPRSTSPCCAAAAGDRGSCRRSSRPS